MSDPDARSGSAGSRGGGLPRYGLPFDLAGSLRHLDDDLLDRLLRAVIDEARRRGRPTGGAVSPTTDTGTEVPRGTRPKAGTKQRQITVPPGQAKIIRAAFEAGVKPGTLARQFRIPRAQIERIVGTSRGRTR